MSRKNWVVNASVLVLATSGMMLPQSAAWSQGVSRESVPGGVEAKPTTPDMARPAAPASEAAVPAKPAEAARAASPAPKFETKVEDEESSSKSSKKKNSAPTTRSLTAPYAAPPPAPIPGMPSSGGDESKPGAVERVPSAPKQPQ